MSLTALAQGAGSVVVFWVISCVQVTLLTTSGTTNAPTDRWSPTVMLEKALIDIATAKQTLLGNSRRAAN